MIRPLLLAVLSYFVSLPATTWAQTTAANLMLDTENPVLNTLDSREQRERLLGAVGLVSCADASGEIFGESTGVRHGTSRLIVARHALFVYNDIRWVRRRVGGETDLNEGDASIRRSDRCTFENGLGERANIILEPDYGVEPRKGHSYAPRDLAIVRLDGGRFSQPPFPIAEYTPEVGQDILVVTPWTSPTLFPSLKPDQASIQSGKIDYMMRDNVLTGSWTLESRFSVRAEPGYSGSPAFAPVDGKLFLAGILKTSNNQDDDIVQYQIATVHFFDSIVDSPYRFRPEQ